ncbi:glycosyl-4,4'-diaponeurosporenoate acyltransferase CrtO family protein [Arthrobacter pigmenti]
MVRFLPFGYWTNRLIRALGARNFRVVKDEPSAKVWVVFTVVVEFGHTVAFGIFVWFMASDMQTDYAGAVWNMLLNLLVNVYPAMAQRYNRLRILNAFNLDLKQMPDWDLPA